MTVFVTKADGSSQPFDRQKVINTCLKMHSSMADAEAVADKIEKRVYNGIPSKKILRMVFVLLKDYSPTVRYQLDVREAVSRMRPKPDFEHFIAIMLTKMGYNVIEREAAGADLLVRGRCIEHEIDAIAKRPGETVYVEVKHHYDMHAFTPLGVCLEVNSTFEDLLDGFRAGRNNLNFSSAMIVCNTKFSEHALRYAHCRGIRHICWGRPDEHMSLGQLIDEHKLYPTTVLKGLDQSAQRRLGDAGVVLLTQLAGADLRELARSTRLQRAALESLSNRASEILAAKP